MISISHSQLRFEKLSRRRMRQLGNAYDIIRQPPLWPNTYPHQALPEVRAPVLFQAIDYHRLATGPAMIILNVNLHLDIVGSRRLAT
jgi:hypothetical protein